MIDHVSTSAAAQMAKLSGEQLRRRILRGEIAAELISGRWAVDRQSLEQWIAHNRPEPASVG